METIPKNEPLKDGEKYTFDSFSADYEIEILRLVEHSHVAFVFKDQKSRDNLRERIYDDGGNLPNSDETRETWKGLHSGAGSSFKVLEPRRDDDCFELRLTSNWFTTEEFRNDVLKKLVALKMVPQEALILFS